MPINGSFLALIFPIDKDFLVSKKYFRGNLVMENLVTPKELATYLKLTETTIYKLASRGELPGFKIGDSWRFEMDEILKLCQKRRRKQKIEKKTDPIWDINKAADT
jgi:excisionase family DNA binding protein